MNNLNTTYIEFSVMGEHFAYDRYSNEFLLLRKNKNSILSSASELGKLQDEYKIFQPYLVPKLALSSIIQDEEKIKNKLRERIVQLCFIMTENCNMRCKYCVYSGSYDGMRKHNTKHPMTWNVAKKVIDNYLIRGKGKSVNFISFYGGEALLEFNLIRQIVEYVHNVDNEIGFAMNTNLTLLTTEMLEFLIEYKIQITVSLDGPEEIHDLYRITQNAKPTQKKVFENLKKIKERSLEYFNNKIIFNVLLVPHSGKMNVVDNFFSQEMFDGVNINSFNVLTLNEKENSFARRYQYEKFMADFLSYSRKLFIDKHVRGVTDFSDMRISYNYYIRAIHHIFTRDKKNLDEYSHYWPNGLCIPGLRSIVVNSDGIFYPCETMYDNKQMSIGNAYIGIDESLVIKYTAEYIENGNSLCKNCWAFRFCSHCFVSCYKDGRYSMEMKRRSCQNTKDGIIDNFKLFMEIYIQNNHAFDYLKDKEREEMYPYMIED